MNCLKCGRETTEDHVFCDSCREEMQKHPVRPGTAVILPKRKKEVLLKKPRHHGHSPGPPEDQIRRLKHQRTWLICLLLVCILCFASSMLLFLNREPEEGRLPGQNYSAVESTGPSGQN